MYLELDIQFQYKQYRKELAHGTLLQSDTYLTYSPIQYAEVSSLILSLALTDLVAALASQENDTVLQSQHHPGGE